MKKTLNIILLLVLISSKADSQVLTIRNLNNLCTVFVTLHAIDFDPTWGNDMPCDIISNTITVPPGTVSWPNLATFASPGPGFSSFTTPVPGTYFTTTTQFEWTDASYQWQCPSPCVGNGGDNMSDPSVTNCFGLPASGTSFGTCITGGTYNNLTGFGFMDDVRLDFN
ncbi:MAG: hypothetical protein KF744_16130 [Taibaiella sp.]|nr:hypothetical protein [Taibaiella sp.]